MASRLGKGPLVACILVGLSLLCGTARAHEFWIDVEDYTVAGDAPIVAQLRVGQMFEGNRVAFNPRRFRRFDILAPDASMPVASRLGDAPALHQAAPGPGPNVVVHVTTDSTLVYDDFEAFARFAAVHGNEQSLTAHEARGLPEAGFTEAYSRYAKALVQVGARLSDAPRDRPVGLPIELVVQGDPLAEPMPERVVVQALLAGSPMPDIVVSVFAKDAAGVVETFDLRTDATGEASVPLTSGRRYLLNVVHLREPGRALAEETGAVWESLWASTTFETGG